MEWKEGNIETARKLYQKALSINSTSETAARCLQVMTVIRFLVSYIYYIECSAKFLMKLPSRPFYHDC